MLPSSAMKAARRSSTTSNDADKIKEDLTEANSGSQNKFASKADSRPCSDQNAKPESSQQKRGASPRRLDNEKLVRADPDSERELRRYDSRRPTSFGDQRDGRNFVDCRTNFETRDNRYPPMDRQIMNQSRAKYSASQERAHEREINKGTTTPRYDDDYRRVTDKQNFGVDAIRRPASLGRYTSNYRNNDLYEHDYYGNPRYGRGLVYPKTEAELRRSDNSGHADYGRKQFRKGGQSSDNYPSLEQGNFYRDQSQRRRSQSVDRDQAGRMSRNNLGRSKYDERQKGSSRHVEPLPTGRHVHPSSAARNSYYEPRCFEEADRSDCNTNRMFRLRYDHFDFDRFALDRFGFDRFGVNEHGYDKYGNCIIF